MKNRLVGGKNKHGRLKTSMNSTIRKRNDPTVARRFVTWGVIISTLMVGVSLFVTFYFNPERMGKSKLEEMARAYYETYYYDKLVGSISSKPFEEQMKVYETSGLQPVLLRQLLLYQNGKYSGYKEYFEKDGFNCDKNATSAQFYPVAPYGRTDYTVKYEYKCETK